MMPTPKVCNGSRHGGSSRKSSLVPQTTQLQFKLAGLVETRRPQVLRGPPTQCRIQHEHRDGIARTMALNIPTRRILQSCNKIEVGCDELRHNGTRPEARIPAGWSAAGTWLSPLCGSAYHRWRTTVNPGSWSWDSEPPWAMTTAGGLNPLPLGKGPLHVAAAVPCGCHAPEARRGMRPK